MAMTFAERMALRKKEAEAGKVSTPLTEVKEEVVEKPKQEIPERFAEQFRKPTGPIRQAIDLDTSSAANPKPSPFLDRLKNSPAIKAAHQVAELEKKLEEVEEEKPSNKIETFTLSKVITMSNVAGQAAPTEGELLLAGDMPEDAIRIKQRIALLSTCDEHSLKSEMDELKKLIKAAPEACQFLLPEELGQCVRALRSMTDNKLAVDMGRAKPRKSAASKNTTPQLTAADLSAALDDL